MTLHDPRPQSGAQSRTPFRLRDADVSDAEAIEAVHYAAREAVYQGRTADWPPRGPDRDGRVARWRAWLSDPGIDCVAGTVGERIVGFSTVRASLDEDADEVVAEMPTLYVHPDHWHRGLGRDLCRAALDRATGRGFRELTLWVLEMNHQARDFYRAFGFEEEEATQVDEGTKEKLVALRYRIVLNATDHG